MSTQFSNYLGQWICNDPNDPERCEVMNCIAVDDNTRTAIFENGKKITLFDLVCQNPENRNHIRELSVIRPHRQKRQQKVRPAFRPLKYRNHNKAPVNVRQQFLGRYLRVEQIRLNLRPHFFVNLVPPRHNLLSKRERGNFLNDFLPG